MVKPYSNDLRERAVAAVPGAARKRDTSIQIQLKSNAHHIRQPDFLLQSGRRRLLLPENAASPPNPLQLCFI